MYQESSPGTAWQDRRQVLICKVLTQVKSTGFAFVNILLLSIRRHIYERVKIVIIPWVS